MKTVFLLLSLLIGSAPLATAYANGDIRASTFGPVASALLAAMHAEAVPCDDLLDVPEVCFVVDATGVGLLAGTVGTVAETFAAAGLRAGPWRAGNGVHSVRLTFEVGGPEALDVFLAEESPSHVRGMLRLSQR